MLVLGGRLAWSVERTGILILISRDRRWSGLMGWMTCSTVESPHWGVQTFNCITFFAQHEYSAAVLHITGPLASNQAMHLASCPCSCASDTVTAVAPAPLTR